MTTLPNPYVGPRSFEQRDRKQFFGRDQETRQIASLVISRRVVLLHAESGAGKTSLLKASLVHYLEQQKKLAVLPLTRVGGDLPPEINAPVANIFVFNTLFNLAEDTQPNTLLNTSLAQGLKPFCEPDPEAEFHPPCLLIIDQFEEIFNHHLDRIPDRADFFTQLQTALQSFPNLSLLLSMRDDYIAQLDNYTGLLPDRIRTRFHLERLKFPAALKAVSEPAKQGGIPFDEGVAEQLVDNLRRTQISRSQYVPENESTAEQVDESGQILGEYVEPVHLQVVCQQLWQKLPDDRERILAEDLESFGNVDVALTTFYETTLQKVTTQTNIAEDVVRRWFSDELITPAHTRGLVYRGPDETNGLPNKAVDILNDAYLIRAEIRGQDKWYELVHDRLVEPILASNQKWTDSNRSPLTYSAEQWEAGGRKKKDLLSGMALQRAKEEVEADPNTFGELEMEYLSESVVVAERHTKNRTLLITIASVMIAGIFAILAIYGWYSTQAATTAAQEANYARATAENTLGGVRTAEAEAQVERENALSAATAASQAEATAEAEALRSSNAEATARASEAEALAAAQEASAAQATAQANEALAIESQARAERLTQESEALAFTVAANSQMQTYPEQSLLLALEAISITDQANLSPLPGTINSLRTLLRESHYYRTLKPQNEELVDFALNPADSLQLAAVSTSGAVEIISLATGATYTLNQADSAVLQIAFAPDGETLATINRRYELTLWDMESGQQEFSVAAHSDTINSVHFGPAGERILTASNDGTAKLWSAETGRILGTLLHPGWVNEAIFNPVGDLIATSSSPNTVDTSASTLQIAQTDNNTLRLWDFATNQVQSLPTTQQMSVMVFSPDGQTLVTAPAEGPAVVWNVPRLIDVAQLANHTLPINDMLFNEAGDTFYTASGDGLIFLWNTSTWAAQARINSHSDWINALALSDDDRYLASASTDRTVQLWDVVRGERVALLEGHQSAVVQVAFSAQAEYLSSLDSSGTVIVWRTQSRSEGQALEGHTASVRDVVFDTTGLYLATASNDGTARLWSVEQEDELETLEGESGWTYRVRFSPDGTRLATADGGDTVPVRSVPLLVELEELEDHVGPVNLLTFVLNGEALLTADAEGTARLWNVADGSLRYTWRWENRTLVGFALHPAGDLVAVGTSGGRVALLNLSTGGELYSVSAHETALTALQFNEDGDMLATGSQDGLIRLWNEAGQALGTLEGHTAQITDLGFSDDGSLLITASGDRTIRLWDVGNQRQVASLSGHSDSVTDLAFSSDNRYFASASADSTVQVWDLASRTSLTTLRGHQGRVNKIAFNPETTLLASVGADTQVILHHLELLDEDLVVETAREQAGRVLGEVDLNNVIQQSASTAFESDPLNIEAIVSIPIGGGGPSVPDDEDRAVSTCSQEPTGEFQGLWRKYQSTLGCPLPEQISPQGGAFAEQPFENGHMFWSESAEIFLVPLGFESGAWQSFPWSPGFEAITCEVGQPPAPELLQPQAGFGTIWCQQEKTRQALGWATAPEQGFSGPTDLIQEFENGLIFRDSDGFSNNLAYIFFEDGTFRRERY